MIKGMLAQASVTVDDGRQSFGVGGSLIGRPLNIQLTVVPQGLSSDQLAELKEMVGKNIEINIRDDAVKKRPNVRKRKLRSKPLKFRG